MRRPVLHAECLDRKAAKASIQPSTSIPKLSASIAVRDRSSAHSARKPWRQLIRLITMSLKVRSSSLTQRVNLRSTPTSTSQRTKLTTRLPAQIQDIVQDLYELMVQSAAYDNVGPGVRSKDILQDTVYRSPSLPILT